MVVAVVRDLMVQVLILFVWLQSVAVVTAADDGSVKLVVPRENQTADSNVKGSAP